MRKSFKSYVNPFFKWIGSLDLITFTRDVLSPFLSILVTVIVGVITLSSGIQWQTSALFLLILIISVLYYLLAFYCMVSIKTETNRYSEISDKVAKLAESKNNYLALETQDIGTPTIIEFHQSVNYYETTGEHYRRANKNIIIFDYLWSHEILRRRVAESDDVKAICKKHYQAIEEHFDKSQEQEINYSRILMLPIGFYSEKKMYDEEYPCEDKTISDLISPITMEHIKSVLDIKDTLKSKNRILIKILPLAIINYSFAIIDYEKLMLELDFYNIIAKPRPNILLIAKGEENKIVEPFLNYYKNYRDSSAIDVNSQTLPNYFNMKLAELRNISTKKYTDKIIESHEKHYCDTGRSGI